MLLCTKSQSTSGASHNLTLMEDARNLSHKSLLYISPELWNYFPEIIPIQVYQDLECQSGKALDYNCRNLSSCLDGAKSITTFFLVFGHCFGEKSTMEVYLVHYCIKLYSDKMSDWSRLLETRKCWEAPCRQRYIQNRVKHLQWNVLRKIVNSFQYKKVMNMSLIDGVVWTQKDF